MCWENPDDLLDCPFCGEREFDAIGLKDHLLTNCSVFAETISVEEERAQKSLEGN